MHLNIVVLPGDGIGPEVMAAALPVLETALRRGGHTLAYTEHPVGGAGIDATGKALPDATLAACKCADAILFGSVGGPRWEHLPPAEQPERASLLPLRKTFDLFANIRPGFLPAALAEASPLRPDLVAGGIDMVCVRELTSGIYFGQHRRITPPDGKDTQAEDVMAYRKSEIERVTDAAVAVARSRKQRIVSVDKANVLACSVLWRETVSARIAATAPEIVLSHMYVDNAAMQLVRAPAFFDVLLTENMFGDILSDEMAAVCGSLGMLASASVGGTKNRHGYPFGLYEPAGGSAPDIAGKNIANPCAQILSAALMLRHSFGAHREAESIETAVRDAVASSAARTADIAFGHPAVGTCEAGNAVLEQLEKQ
ncbi:MAG: 3-isopropylmalate dehydrogenase [Puniceicoccales bacterium]|jgi:3-isopropylmalate dehydrogenase|nr:3-isopropylmalate dehydrogenase [Puniceicoccales bacterium]